MQPAPFEPDALYCVYCHAPAAGSCAACGALCCADCVELLPGILTPRAVCTSCIRDGRLPAGRSAFVRGTMWAAGLTALLALAVYWAYGRG